jgi:hypothetical protein
VNVTGVVNKCLTGKKEIMLYTRRSWVTIHGWIKNSNFPARKLDGVWESATDLIDDWKKSQITRQ